MPIKVTFSPGAGIHAVVFDPATGELNRLEVDFRPYLDELGDIYNLAFDEPVSLEARTAEQQKAGREVETAAAADDTSKP